ncbi:DUF3824 domain-containing protein [Paenibacillus sp. KQZ6P-2]|uniref:DUF3824 domain-containing protein n=1 Tax=Paenibacillus mangrovi TaxID=2931978 RepID=A0A9X1WL96_9BACL|nr:DUF3824 domain-containing protein [Paenibacillus mangrovi]MCJ8011033.1 DUF3824 domain-containing protein [Paenibacillus mangrovi]
MSMNNNPWKGKMNLEQNRNKMSAFILNFIPGLGHYYMGRKGRGFIYPLLFFGGILLGFMLMVASNDKVFFGLTAFCAAVLWIFCMLDLIIYLLRMPPAPYPPHGYQPNGYQAGGYQAYANPGNPPSGMGLYPEQENNFEAPNMHFEPYPPQTGSSQSPESERFYTILLSFVPGLGHLHMGLMQRGLSFLIAFFGLGTIMFFLTGLTSHSVFLLFLGVLPIIWLYCMFDAVQLIHRRQAGEILLDRSLFDDMEAGREEGKRSKVLATLLSAFPGAGHMYLGLQKRGLQLMIFFLGSVYVLDVLHLSLFLFLIPLIWFFSFFDGLQQTSRYGREPLIDRPIVEGISNHQRWLGVGLMILGIYYVGTSILVPAMNNWFPNMYIDYKISHYLKPIIVAVLLIAGGIKLMLGTGKSRADKERKFHGK